MGPHVQLAHVRELCGLNSIIKDQEYVLNMIEDHLIAQCGLKP